MRGVVGEKKQFPKI